MSIHFIMLGVAFVAGLLVGLAFVWVWSLVLLIPLIGGTILCFVLYFKRIMDALGGG